MLLLTPVLHLLWQATSRECSPLGGAIGLLSDSSARSWNLPWFRNNDHYCWRVYFVTLLFLPDLYLCVCACVLFPFVEIPLLLVSLLPEYGSASHFLLPMLTLCFPPKSLQHPLNEEQSNEKYWGGEGNWVWLIECSIKFHMTSSRMRWDHAEGDRDSPHPPPLLLPSILGG